MNDTTFVKPLSWDVFFQDTLLRGYVDVALRNNHSFQQSMERIAMSRAALQRAKELLLPDVNLNIGASVNRFGEYTMDGVGNSETNVPSLPKDKHIPDLPGFRLELELSMGSGYLGQTDPEEAGRRRSLDGFRGGYPFCPVDVDLRFGDSIL